MTAGSQDMLSLLEADTDKAIKQISQQRKPEDLLAEIDLIGQEMEKSTTIVDKTTRTTRDKVLKASLEALHKSVAQEQADLGQAVMGLNGLMTAMGKDYENLTKPSAAELALIKNANQRLADAKVALEGAKIAWLFRSSKIAAAEAEIEAAEQGITNAKTQAASLARTRLMKATMEDSLQEFMFKVEKTIEIMKARKTDIEKQIVAVGLRKQDAYRVKEGAAKKLEQLEAELTQIEQTLQTEEQNITSMTNGSEEYVAQERLVSETRRRVEEIRGNRNNALVLFQSKERFAAELEVHERAQMKLRDNQRSWITLLTSDTQERVVTFKSRLEAMKAMSDQDVAKNLDKVGVEVDGRNVEFMAQVGSASDRARMEMVESQPERVKRISEAQANQAEAQQQIREREAEVISEFRKKYGIDPLDSSFFSYAKDDQPALEPEAASA
jgi:hypothetical protein